MEVVPPGEREWMDRPYPPLDSAVAEAEGE